MFTFSFFSTPHHDTTIINKLPLEDPLSRSKEGSKKENDDFKLYINDYEVTDFSLFIEKMLSSNDENFPVIMDFLELNNLVPELKDIYKHIGFGIVTKLSDGNSKWRLIRNLTYLKERGCDLNLELLNFLRSLTFGGKLIKHGDLFTNVQVMKTILPFCTNFFADERYWHKIRYFCFDTQEVIDALEFLILSYGKENNCKYLQRPQKNAFSLKHLARSKVRDIIYSSNYRNNRKQGRDYNVTFYNLCETNLPTVLFDYINFLD